MTKKSAKSTKASKNSKKTDRPASDRILAKFRTKDKASAKKKDDGQGLLPHEQTTDLPLAKPTIAEPGAEAATVAPTGDAEPASANDTTDTAEPGAPGGKRLGLVSAAIQILADAGADASMNVKEMVEQVTAKGLWSPARGGKTPAASLYASIFREIKQKGEASRFIQPERGKFALKQ